MRKFVNFEDYSCTQPLYIGGNMKKRWRLKNFLPVFVSLCAMSILMSCASSGEQYTSPTAQKQLKERVDTLGMHIQALEESNAELRNKLSGNGQMSIGGSELNQIENRLSMLENHMEYADSTRFDLVNRVSRLEKQLQQYGISTATTTSPGKAGTASMSTAAYRQQYQHAYDLYGQKKYTQAIPAFTKVIEANPDGSLSDNAQYWIGECYYGLQDFTRAIVEFEKVFTFKNSNKDDDAQLKLGLCYLNLGQRAKAKEEFQRLIDFYSDSEYKALAIDYLNKLN